MSGKKKILAALLCGLILLAMIWGMIWHVQHYVIVDMRLYPRDAGILDLREERMTISRYEKLSRKLPDTQILWNVPFQGESYAQNIQSLTVTELREGDLKTIGYFQNLKTVDALGCSDYGQIRLLQETYPHLEVDYQVKICGRGYAPDARSLTVDSLTMEELALLEYLPELKEVCVEGPCEASVLEELKALCAERGLAFLIVLGGEGRDQQTASLTLENTTQKELALLQYLPTLKAVHLRNPEAEAAALVNLAAELPDAAVTWEVEVLGMTVSSDEKTVDLTRAISPEGARAYEQARTANIHGDRDETTWLFAANSRYPVPDLSASTADLIAQVERAMACLPQVETVLMTGALLDNETMAAFREAQRQNYKVVWTVQCGGMIARTDTPYFMPTKYHEYYFHDEDSVNLKYCEDMVCVDLGHMSIKHVEWAAYMPNLEYLVLAHTDVRSIEPLRSCKKLKFLEVDWSALKDFSPLLDCTALEDLNLGNTYGNFEVIENMTWLKNLWMIGCSRSAVYRITQALPQVNLVASGSATVDSGWRELPNYYAMRDIMNMYYMEW